MVRSLAGKHCGLPGHKSEGFQASRRFRLTAPRLLLDDCDAWTLNASLTRLSSYRKCSKRRILGPSAQATSLLPIEGTMKCSRTARGSEFGNGMASAAEASPQQSGLGKSKARVLWCCAIRPFWLAPVDPQANSKP